MRYKIELFLIHNFDKQNNTESTKLGSFESSSIIGIGSQVITILNSKNLKFEYYIEIINYYAVLKVLGSDLGNIVDVCITEENHPFQVDLENEMRLMRGDLCDKII